MKCYLRTDVAHGSTIHLYTDEKLTKFSLNINDVAGGGSVGDCKRVLDLHVLQDAQGPYIFVTDDLIREACASILKA